jgi:hypothetical protein
MGMPGPWVDDAGFHGDIIVMLVRRARRTKGMVRVRVILRMLLLGKRCRHIPTRSVIGLQARFWVLRTKDVSKEQTSMAVIYSHKVAATPWFVEVYLWVIWDVHEQDGA